jgi:hypothetical protein
MGGVNCRSSRAYGASATLLSCQTIFVVISLDTFIAVLCMGQVPVAVIQVVSMMMMVMMMMISNVSY